MKIISKFKDFYDYEVAKYGMDEKLVYIRKTYSEYYQRYIKDISNKMSEEDFYKNFKKDVKFFNVKNWHKILFVGDKLVHLFFTENGIYTHFDIKYPKDLSERYEGLYSWKEATFNDGNKYNIDSKFGHHWDKLLYCSRKNFFSDKFLKSDVVFSEPMILIEYVGKYRNEKIRKDNSTSFQKFTYNPNLSRLGIYINEEFVWQSLAEFLSNKRSEKEIIPEISDKDKILSKGFDLKVSFRPKMKRKK